MRLLLASASPRRRELLAAAGIACDVEAVDVDERRHDGEAPAAYVERLARLKAAAAATRHPGRVILAADTAVVLGADLVLGKPAGPEEAARMLEQLSGRSHDVLTGIALSWNGEVRTRVEDTTVWMNAISQAEIAEYVATGEPLDKAGAYGIQGMASRFIPRIEGSYTNVVGLPVAAVYGLLHEIGLLRSSQAGHILV